MTLSSLAVALVAVLHVAFFVLESLLWTRPPVRRAMGLSEEEARATRVLALNQGFYNLGAAGLLLCFLWTENQAGVTAVLVFIATMGLVGAISANWRILLLQSLPAMLALLLR